MSRFQRKRKMGGDSSSACLNFLITEDPQDSETGGTEALCSARTSSAVCCAAWRRVVRRLLSQRVISAVTSARRLVTRIVALFTAAATYAAERGPALHSPRQVQKVRLCGANTTY